MNRFEPPETTDKTAYLPGSATMRRYVATLTDIEQYCQEVLAETPVGNGRIVAQGVLDVIGRHWHWPT
jgi:hypothetical protein